MFAGFCIRLPKKLSRYAGRRSYVICNRREDTPSKLLGVSFYNAEGEIYVYTRLLYPSY